MFLKKLAFIILTFVSMISFAKNVEIKKKRAPNQDMTQEQRLAVANFSNFLNCQKFARRETSEENDEQKLLQCMAQFLHPSVGLKKVIQYAHFLRLKHEMSEPYQCPNDLVQNLKALSIDFDLAFCFESFRKPTNVEAVVIFKNDRAGLPRIIQLKF